MNPAELLNESRILLGINGFSNKESVIELLVRTAMGEDSPLVEPVVQNLLAREAKMTTGIGRGVAIPHTRAEGLDKPVAALGVSQLGIDYDAIDDEPVHIIFSFVTPESAAALHIRTLGKAVGIFGDFAVREAIMRAETARDVMKILSARND